MERFGMKMKWTTLLLAVGICVAVTGCGKDEDEPEIVDDPMHTNAYYIAGAVYDYETSAPLAGVTVAAGDQTAVTAANGAYQLAMPARKTYTVAFTREAYLGVSGEVEIAGDAANHSSVFFSVKLSEKGVPVTVGASGALVGNKASADASSVGLAIPAGAVPAGSQATISITPYLEPAAVSSHVATGQQSRSLSLGEMHIESTLASFSAPVTLLWQHTAGGSLAFSDAEVWANGKAATKAPQGWQQEGVAQVAGDGYAFSTSQLESGYSLEVTASQTTSALNREPNLVNGQAEVTVDNSGHTAAVADFKLTTQLKAGWEYTTSPGQALSALGLSGADLGTMSALLARAVEEEEGGVPGTYTLEEVMHTAISGGYIMHYKNEATYYNRSYTFDCVSQGQHQPVTVGVKRYVGSVSTYSNQAATQHSGGKF